MPLRFLQDGLFQVRTASKWLLLIFPMAGVVGSACALFLWSLDCATRTRFDYPWLLYFLPLAGVGLGFLYHRFGKSAEGGNNLIMDQIHEPGGGVPRRMAPLILISTVITHLFGGSAGREGTAVQMGGSIASGFAKAFRLPGEDLRILLMTGIAAGFGAVFGTRIAGAVFALEVLAIGRMRYEALIPCLFAAVIGDWSCQVWGIQHLQYHIDFMGDLSANGSMFHLDPLLLVKVLLAAVAFGWAGSLFAELSHTLQGLFKWVCPYAPFRPAIGGILLIGLVYVLGTREYLGLGVWSPNPNDVTIPSLFHGDIHYWSWAWKILFTAITLSTGFKGGEVTLYSSLGLPWATPFPESWEHLQICSQRWVSWPSSRAPLTRHWLVRSWGSSCLEQSMAFTSLWPVLWPTCAAVIPASTCLKEWLCPKHSMVTFHWRPP